MSQFKTTTNLFFSIFKNTYLFHYIFNLCKYQDKIAYSYYDIPLQFLCKKERFDLFDHRWKLGFNNNNDGGMVKYEHLLNIHYCDVIAFFKYNTCKERLQRVWDISFQVLKENMWDIRYDVQNDMDCVFLSLLQHGTNEMVDIFITFIYKDIKRLFYCGNTFQSLAKKVGLIGSIKVYQQSLVSLELVYKFPQNDYAYPCLVAASQEHKMELFIHIFYQILDQDPKKAGYVEFQIERMSQECSNFIIDHAPHHMIELFQFPFDGMCLDEEYMLKILKFRTDKYKSLLEKVIDYDKAYSMGNVKLLEFMYKHCPPSGTVALTSIPNIQTLQLYLNHSIHSDPYAALEGLCNNSLELYQLLHYKRFQFTSSSLDGCYEVIEFLYENGYLSEIPFQPNKIQRCFHQDIRIITMLHQVYDYEFQVSCYDFQRLALNGKVEAVEYLLKLHDYFATGEISKSCFEQIISNNSKNPQMFNLLMQHVSSLTNKTFIQGYLSGIRIGKYPTTMVVLEWMKEIYPNKCLFSQFSKFNFDRQEIQIPRVFKLLLHLYNQTPPISSDNDNCNSNNSNSSRNTSIIQVFSHLIVLIKYSMQNGHQKLLNYCMELLKQHHLYIPRDRLIENVTNLNCGYYEKSIIQTQHLWNHTKLYELLSYKPYYKRLCKYLDTSRNTKRISGSSGYATINKSIRLQCPQTHIKKIIQQTSSPKIQSNIINNKRKLAQRDNEDHEEENDEDDTIMCEHTGSEYEEVEQNGIKNTLIKSTEKGKKYSKEKLKESSKPEDIQAYIKPINKKIALVKDKIKKEKESKRKQKKKKDSHQVPETGPGYEYNMVIPSSDEKLTETEILSPINGQKERFRSKRNIQSETNTFEKNALENMQESNKTLKKMSNLLEKQTLFTGLALTETIRMNKIREKSLRKEFDINSDEEEDHGFHQILRKHVENLANSSMTNEQQPIDKATPTTHVVITEKMILKKRNLYI
ncbi:hypothetical protein CYY_009473 [Polysphondylium violaceum]|uniref:Uncharacterized protein n=1 Tax=Polysphondylium violaceum TaxID=133409 RepID=A0A8J4PK48_9MYCE|nr:hypothetical protein CYY_009473 [Polysphondylium violaceum]